MRASDPPLRKNSRRRADRQEKSAGGGGRASHFLGSARSSTSFSSCPALRREARRRRVGRGGARREEKRRILLALIPPEEAKMSTTLVTLNGKAVAAEAPDKNVITIHITQESFLTYLFRALGQHFAKHEKAAQKTSASSDSSSSRGCYKGEQKVLGSIQMLLGLLCIALGVLDSIQEPIVYEVIDVGAPFWMGSLFFFSGAWSIVGERCGGRWLSMATFFNLASVVSGIVALAFGIAQSATYYWYDDICERRQDAPWDIVATAAPEEWRVRLCKDHVRRLVNVVWGIRILLLVFSVAALGIALFSFGYGLWVLCQSLKANLAYTALGDAEVPPPYEDQPRAEQSDACPVV